MNIKKIVKIDFFKEVKKYDGHEINDYFIYKIKLEHTDEVFTNSITNIFGYNLKELNKYCDDVEILEFVEYTRTFNNNNC